MTSTLVQGWDTLIRNHVNKYPVVFAFNIKKSVHDGFGLSLYENPLKVMQREKNNVVYPLPIFNYKGTLTIDLRAKRMRNEIQKVLLLQREKHQQSPNSVKIFE